MTRRTRAPSGRHANVTCAAPSVPILIAWRPLAAGPFPRNPHASIQPYSRSRLPAVAGGAGGHAHGGL
ncbi:hypothetical protein FGX01_02910, partial [Xylella fastidiosa subsp. multiplex]|nr:hypothetical protein [Xylella fastidiosa subsp. multiplex]